MRCPFHEATAYDGLYSRGSLKGPFFMQYHTFNINKEGLSTPTLLLALHQSNEEQILSSHSVTGHTVSNRCRTVAPDRLTSAVHPIMALHPIAPITLLPKRIVVLLLFDPSLWNLLSASLHKEICRVTAVCINIFPYPPIILVTLSAHEVLLHRV